MWVADLKNGNYRNPVLYADYSDPDAIRVGEDYFMIASSFSNSPSFANFAPSNLLISRIFCSQESSSLLRDSISDVSES